MTSSIYSFLLNIMLLCLLRLIVTLPHSRLLGKHINLNFFIQLLFSFILYKTIRLHNDVRYYMSNILKTHKQNHIASC